jgi:trk system potassium uptake protein TrkH
VNTLHLRSATFICAVFAGYVAALMLIPAAIDLYKGNRDWQVFAVSAVLVGGVGAAVALATQGARPSISTRFGFLLVNMLWVATALSGAVPFMAASIGLSFTDAMFESVSGLTTTGATVIAGLDGLPPGLLLWRSFLQMIGGIGVIALGLFVLPFLKDRILGDRRPAVRPVVLVHLRAGGDLRDPHAPVLPCLCPGRHEPVRRHQPCHDDDIDRRLLDP